MYNNGASTACLNCGRLTVVASPEGGVVSLFAKKNGLFSNSDIFLGTFHLLQKIYRKPQHSFCPLKKK